LELKAPKSISCDSKASSKFVLGCVAVLLQTNEFVPEHHLQAGFRCRDLGELVLLLR
jgi:hypothetical protein